MSGHATPQRIENGILRSATSRNSELEMVKDVDPKQSSRCPYSGLFFLKSIKYQYSNICIYRLMND